MQLQVPASFWDDHSDRCPADDENEMCVEVARKGRRVTIECDDRQLETLRSDAAFYAEGNVDDAARLVQSAKATLAAIAKQVVA